MNKPEWPAREKLNPAEEWLAWKPSEQDPFNIKWAAHLYRRAGFGATPGELKQAVRDGLDATIDTMLAPPSKPIKPLPRIDSPNQPAGVIQIRAAWLQRMLAGAEPLRERLTLFWHNHFATSIGKIQDARLMQRQNDLIRKHALGRFRPFLEEMSRDAAMLIWLDSNQNIKGHPNENFAREVMELFSLGVGNYTEKDIQEGARAFTGWHVSSAEGEQRFALKLQQHDTGVKTVLGQTGGWDGDDVIRILLEQPACSRFLVRKLYRALVNETADVSDALLQPLADQLRKADCDISVTVKTILKSRHFFSEHAYLQRVKSPVDYVMGISRMFGTGGTGNVVISPYSLLATLELQGQQLFAPPNVKGWEGGKAWLSTATVLARHNFAYELCNGMKQLNAETTKITGQPFVPSIDPLSMYRREKIEEAAKIVEYYGGLLLPGNFKPEVAAKLTGFIGKDSPLGFEFEQRCRDALYSMMTLPQYQLC